MRRTTALLIAVVAAPALVLGACSDEDQDKAKEQVEDVRDDVAEGIDTATARGQAEALRASLKANSTADREGLRSMRAIRQAVEDLPGDPDVTGVEDGDGDGQDDDGNVEVRADGKSACVTLPAEGEDAEVSSGAC